MRRIAVVAAGLLVVAGIVLAIPATSQANAKPQHTAHNPLSITGSVVAGVTSVQEAGRILTFDFTAKNHGSMPVNMDFFYSTTHAKVLDIICPLISSGSDISPDTPACEPGSLAPHRSTQSAIVIKAPASPGTIVINACADDEDNGATPPCRVTFPS